MSGSDVDDPINTDMLRHQIGSLLSDAGVTLGQPMQLMQSAQSAQPVQSAPRNYEPDHLRKLTTAQLFSLSANLEKMAKTQTGIDAHTTRVCINRIRVIITEKV